MSKIRIFGRQNAPLGDPRVVTFKTGITLEELLEKATSKLKPESKFLKAYAEHGVPIKATADIKPDSIVFFSCGEAYNGPSPPPEKKEPPAAAAAADAAAAAPAATGSPDKASDPAPTKSEPAQPKTNLFSRLAARLGKSPEKNKKQGPEKKQDGATGADEEKKASDAAPGGEAEGSEPPVPVDVVPAKKKPTLFGTLGAMAGKFIEERKEKFAAVMERAKEAMDDVKAKSHLKDPEPGDRPPSEDANAAGSSPSHAAHSDADGADLKTPALHGDPLAVLEVTIFRGRGMKAVYRPYVSVTVEGVSRQTWYAEGHDPVWHGPDGANKGNNSNNNSSNNTKKVPKIAEPFKFQITDPTGDVRVALCDSTAKRRDKKLGRVIIPLWWLREGVPGTWRGVKGWFKVFPMPSDSGVTDKLTQQLTGGLQAKSDSEFEELKFFAALPKEKGSGLPDPQKPLGEIYLEVRSYAAEGAGLAKMAKSYLEPAMSGATIARWTIVDEDVDSMLERSEDAHIFSVEGMQRLIHRIKNLTKGAPLLLRPPWSLGTLVWLYKASFRTDSTNWPWLVWYLFALQGISLWWTRTIDIIVWEHEVKKGPSKTVFEYGAMIRKILRILGAYQYKAELVVSTLERVKNALSLSDPFASTLLYTFLFLFASLAQFILSFLPSGLGIFLLGFSILFPPWIKVYKDYKYGKNRKKKKDWIDMLIRELRTRFENFLNHVPDENELNHRHICKMQEIKEEKLPKEKSAPVPVEPKAGGAAAAPAAARGDDRKRNDPLDLARPASTPVESI